MSMRIKILQKATRVSIDGIRLDRFEAGCTYEVGSVVGALLLAEGYAEPAADAEPALLVPLDSDERWSYVKPKPTGSTLKSDAPANLIRDPGAGSPGKLGIAADAARRRKRRR